MYRGIRKHIPILYFVFIGFIVFSNNGRISLWDQDEAAYAGFAREMVTSGDWSVPEFMWSEIHRKPPLHFWNICLSYKIFGINEFSVRFPSALFTLLTYLLIYLAGSPVFGRRSAFLGTVVLSTSLFIPALAKVSVTDSTLVFFSTLCVFSVLYVLRQPNWKWVFVFWISFALGLLTKGPPVVLFCGVLTALIFLLHPQRRNLLAFRPWFFLPLACLPLFAWGYYVSRYDGGEFIQWMVDWYILKRMNGSVLGQTGPPGTHLLGIILFFIPYFMFLPRALWNGVSGAFKKEKSTVFLLSAWFIAGWFLFEWTPSKLPAYVVCAHVPLALLIARSILEYQQLNLRPASAFVIVHFVLMTLLAMGLTIGPSFISIPGPERLSFIAIGMVMLIGIGLCVYSMNSARFANTIIGVNLLFQLTIWVILLPQLDKLRDGSREVASYIRRKASPESTILIANDKGKPPSLPFYLGLDFSKVREEYNFDTLMSKLKSDHPYVLVLDREQRDSSAKLFPGLRFKAIHSLLTDRKGEAAYYIAINPNGCADTLEGCSFVRAELGNVVSEKEILP